MDLKALFREGIRKARPYVPGKPIEEVQRELGLDEVFKLASNENPEGPLPEVIEAIAKALPEINRYPDGSAFTLTRALAEFLGVPPNALLLGNGSNEVIDMLVRALVSPGENVVFSEKSFIVYPLICRVHFETGRAVPMTQDLRHDLPAMADAVDSRTKLVIICNPNNPTGTYVTAQEFEDFLESLPEHVIVAVDEAYYEYVTAPDYPQTLPMLQSNPNIFILRTFSKIHSLAGLRVGYGIGHPDLVDELQKTREPFNVNSISQAGALACIRHGDAIAGRARRNLQQREWLAAELSRLGLNVVPSQTNFIFCTLPGQSGSVLSDKLLQQGIIVRPMDAFGLSDGEGAVRISVGLPQENARCVAALKEILR
jgi:histidinol-phosphate aminotransferase